jgi:hypothetical protein
LLETINYIYRYRQGIEDKDPNQTKQYQKAPFLTEWGGFTRLGDNDWKDNNG